MLKPLTIDHNKLWKIFKEMEIPDNLSCLLKNLYVRPQKRHRSIEQSFGLFGRGRRGMILENGIETGIISYKK